MFPGTLPFVPLQLQSCCAPFSLLRGSGHHCNRIKSWTVGLDHSPGHFCRRKDAFPALRSELHRLTQVLFPAPNTVPRAQLGVLPPPPLPKY